MGGPHTPLIPPMAVAPPRGPLAPGPPSQRPYRGMKVMKTESNTAPLIDELGDVRSRIASLELKEAALRKQVAEPKS
jgi:hypothetical protein